MKSIFTVFAKLFSSRSMRHNPAAPWGSESVPQSFSPNSIAAMKNVTRAEFLSIYQNMPERARTELFVSLDYRQKERLLKLIAGGGERGKKQAGPAIEHTAEDFLPEHDERKILRLRQIREVRDLKDRFAAMEKSAPQAIADVLAKENPPLIAAVLLQFTQQFASRVLKALPNLMPSEVVRAMAAKRQVASEALVAVQQKMAARLIEIEGDAPQKIDGIKHVNEILKLLGAEDAERITREVKAVDTNLGQHIEKERYAFEDLTALNARDFRILFSALPDEQLWARALKAFDQGQRKALLGKLPLKRAGLIVTAMSEVQTTRLDSIDKARTRILSEALKLAARHEIKFANNGLH